MPGHRAARIAQIIDTKIERKEKFSLSDLHKIQLDTVSLAAQDLAKELKKLDADVLALLHVPPSPLHPQHPSHF